MMLVRNITLLNIANSSSPNFDVKKKKALVESRADVFVKSPTHMVEVAQSQSSLSFSGLGQKRLLSDLNEIVAQELSSPSALIKEVKAGFIEKLAQKLSDYKVKPLIIGITGEPASGKTTVASSILGSAQKLSKNKNDLIASISCDSYYEDLTEQLKIHKNYAGILATGYDPHHPKTQNLDLLRRHLSSLKKGEKVLIPEYFFDTCQSVPNKITVKPSKIIMYEGIFALNPKLADLCDIKVYVDTPQKLIEQRSVNRGLSRGNNEEATKKLLFGLENSTQKFIRSSKENSDLIISGDAPKEAVPNLLNKLFSMFNR